MVNAICLYESRQPSAVSIQLKAFMFCCARQGMAVIMKEPSVSRFFQGSFVPVRACPYGLPKTANRVIQCLRRKVQHIRVCLLLPVLNLPGIESGITQWYSDRR
jgi:hypothetical protein